MLSPQLLELLRAWWREGRRRSLLLRGGWLFPGRNPVEPLSARQFNRAIHAAAQAAGIIGELIAELSLNYGNPDYGVTLFYAFALNQAISVPRFHLQLMDQPLDQSFLTAANFGLLHEIGHLDVSDRGDHQRGGRADIKPIAGPADIGRFADGPCRRLSLLTQRCCGQSRRSAARLRRDARRERSVRCEGGRPHSGQIRRRAAVLRFRARAMPARTPPN